MDKLKKGDYAVALIGRQQKKIRIMRIREENINEAGMSVEPRTYFYVCVCDELKYMWLPKDKLVEKKPRASSLPRPSLMGPDSKKFMSSHIPWCIVCGGVVYILQCDRCPASYHPSCEKLWVFNRNSRNNKDSNKEIEMPDRKDLVRSATTCPSCIYGPAINYGDIVWNRNSSFPWWPARILKPGTLPPCLLKKCNTYGQWPIKYYNEEKYTWVTASSICLFFPCHYDVSKSGWKTRDTAITEACRDYIELID